MDDEDTEVGPAPRPDTDRGPAAVMLADTAERADTTPEVDAQGTIDTTAELFDDTGIVILDRAVIVESEPAQSDRLVITFRDPKVRCKPRATTACGWPPPPRAPARHAPRRAAIFAIVARPATKL